MDPERIAGPVGALWVGSEADAQVRRVGQQGFARPRAYPFMAALTSADYKEQGLNELARQRAISRTYRPRRDTARAFGPKLPLPKLPDLFRTPAGSN